MAAGCGSQALATLPPTTLSNVQTAAQVFMLSSTYELQAAAREAPTLTKGCERVQGSPIARSGTLTEAEQLQGLGLPPRRQVSIVTVQALNRMKEPQYSDTHGVVNNRASVMQSVACSLPPMTTTRLHKLTSWVMQGVEAAAWSDRPHSPNETYRAGPNAVKYPVIDRNMLSSPQYEPRPAVHMTADSMAWQQGRR